MRTIGSHPHLVECSPSLANDQNSRFGMGYGAAGCGNQDVEGACGRGGNRFRDVQAEAGKRNPRACDRHILRRQVANNAFREVGGKSEMDIPGKSALRLNLYFKESAASALDGLGVVKEGQCEITGLHRRRRSCMAKLYWHSQCRE